ncbi:hypothetical protein RHMOL_Rhmol13G0061400 [Rhododendron molle]|uniref:Uncharacterized protein n=1 Tax=Rhododendron molle TaxID=49168 RepID=A0ACC0L3J7_RHOML|nr:hypothetical protein RHMOL_Rhmol13G0061400 [Rhododendron molle]
MAAAAQQPVSPQVVGNAFVQQYYHIQHQSPALVHRFYQDISKLGRPDGDGNMSTTTTMQAINEKILSLNYGEFRAEIKSVDAQESYNGGVHVLVTGYLSGKDNMIQNFTQTFFLAPQEKGYFVLNDIFRYVEDIKHANGNQSSGTDIEAPLTPEQDPSPEEVNHVSEQTVVPAEVHEDEELNPLDSGGVSVEEEEVPVAEVVDEEVPVAEVVDELPDDSQVVSESVSKIEEVPKKSYASIVMVMKESAAPLFSPAPVPRKSPAKSQAPQVSHAQVSAAIAETPVSGSDAADNGSNQEGEADGYSIYIKGLPMNATAPLLEDEFKKFGTIKAGGVQVRSNKQGFCFGFVEFEVESAVQKAIEWWMLCVMLKLVFAVIELVYSHSCKMTLWWSVFQLTMPSTMCLGGGSVEVGLLPFLLVDVRHMWRKRGLPILEASWVYFPSLLCSDREPRKGNNRGRFVNGRGSGFRNEGLRGRGNYGGSGGRGYNRSDFNGRTEFGNNRSSNRGGFSNRGGDGYQRADNNGGSGGGRANRGGGMGVNGTAKTLPPRVSATA